ncbi:MAG TPA: hypothetical protein PLS67_05930 [Accumulibacter sp.]|jgi:hypothetical protein|nr:hypothetical protein [Accumulibacter sp.]HQC80047.1 hypothetical protein [Accumulibacter sp.]
MKTDLTREQIMLIVDHARHQRSVASGEVSAVFLRKSALWLGHGIDKFLHLLLMSPTAHR